MGLDKEAGDVQAQAQALSRLAGLDLVEALEDMCLFLDRNPAPWSITDTSASASLWRTRTTTRACRCLNERSPLAQRLPDAAEEEPRCVIPGRLLLGAVESRFAEAPSQRAVFR